MDIGGYEFDEVVVGDFEFRAPPGSQPKPVCFVGHELVSGRVHHLWLEEPVARPAPPFSTGKNTLFVAFYNSAEFGCFNSLRWPMPERAMDLFAEFRCLTNGTRVPCGNGLLGALTYFGEDAMSAAEKKSMRDLILRGGPRTPEDRDAILAYCEEDVIATTRLLNRMVARIDLPRALLRGRYMISAARMEWTGIPVDVPAFETLRNNWVAIQADLVRDIDSAYGVYNGISFSQERFAAYLVRNGIPWPLLASGRLALDQDTFKDMARIYPQLNALKELRASMSQMRLTDLYIGPDGRNRCILSAFHTVTSRNSPSPSHFMFGPAVWLRGLIRPDPGRVLFYADYEQQEFGIAAALSGDTNMMAAYLSGDPYWEFARLTGAVPRGATPKSHPHIRERYKTASLAVLYGQGAWGLAVKLGIDIAEAAALLAKHRRAFPRFWAWSDAAVDFATMYGYLDTVFGWRMQVAAEFNARSFRNFPMQANGGDILRLACSLATERGIDVCAPVHDALLTEGDVGNADDVQERTQAAMEEASAIALGGFRLRTDVKRIVYPARYVDKRGAEMWKSVWKLVPGGEP